LLHTTRTNTTAEQNATPNQSASVEKTIVGQAENNKSGLVIGGVLIKDAAYSESYKGQKWEVAGVVHANMCQDFGGKMVPFRVLMARID